MSAEIHQNIETHKIKDYMYLKNLAEKLGYRIGGKKRAPHFKVYYPNGKVVMDETHHPVTIPKGRKANSGTYFGILKNLEKYALELAEAV